MFVKLYFVVSFMYIINVLQIGSLNRLSSGVHVAKHTTGDLFDCCRVEFHVFPQCPCGFPPGSVFLPRLKIILSVSEICSVSTMILTRVKLNMNKLYHPFFMGYCNHGNPNDHYCPT